MTQGTCIRRQEAEVVLSLSNHGYSGLFSDLAVATVLSGHCLLVRFHYQASRKL